MLRRLSVATLLVPAAEALRCRHVARATIALLALAVPSVLLLESAVDATTKTTFPSTMQRDHTDYRLLGLGARQVTFLRISVYVLGVFIPVDYNIPSGTTLDDLVHSSTPLLLRLQPVRSTTGAHLRDGFVRSLLECMKRDRLTDSEQQIVMAAIDEFKRMFPKGEVAKGDVLTLHRNSGGYLEMEYQGILCGTVKSKWLADSLFHAYVRQDRPISPKARESIVDGFTRYQTPQYRPLT